MQQYKTVKSKLEESLRNARDTKFKCEVLFPCGTTSKIAQDVLRMSSQEPYGLRGCVLYVNLEEKNVCRKVACVEMDPTTVATFELYLTLKEDTRGWCMLEKIYLTLKGCFKNSKWKSMPKILCSGFILEKKKLYRTNH
ncbi:hypothetical protein LOTGIDRAFT_110160 [Lottia gigantea]|uniref:Protein scylla n=1 Tax=Lottia gigantea TaxID=225164 RepID=V4B155_LOTGI|nr:hypothetical protein LOTGIDRAFT_110160 [Lottia gigantea]ESP04023.1 hypothetical protein LOTGIDRAFT_110160 [Lottia gigantea]